MLVRLVRWRTGVLVRRCAGALACLCVRWRSSVLLVLWYASGKEGSKISSGLLCLIDRSRSLLHRLCMVKVTRKIIEAILPPGEIAYRAPMVFTQRQKQEFVCVTIDDRRQTLDFLALDASNVAPNCVVETCSHGCPRDHPLGLITTEDDGIICDERTRRFATHATVLSDKCEYGCVNRALQ